MAGLRTRVAKKRPIIRPVAAMSTRRLKASAQSRKTKSPIAPNLRPGFLTPIRPKNKSKERIRRGKGIVMEIQYNGRVPWMSMVIQASRAQWLNNYHVCQTSVNVTSRLYMSLCETFGPLLDDATVGLLYC